MMDRDRELHEMADEGRALMSDYIKRIDALDIVAHNNVHGEITLNRYDKIIDGIYEIPSADVAPVRHGWWDTNEDNRIVCSECKHGTPYMYKISDKLIMQELTDYCPYCGAFMDKDGDDDEKRQV